MQPPASPSMPRLFLALCPIALCFLTIASACQDQAAPAASSGNQNSGKDARRAGGIDADKAYEHVKRLVAMGPRPAGSPAIKKSQDYIESELKSYGLKVIEDKFTGDTPHGPIPMMNIIAELPGQKSDVVLITGHYDTAPMRDFVGANDGGSSTASVLEIARVMSKTKPEMTLWFVFFDGEEAVISWETNNGMDNTYGSRHLVSSLQKDGRLGGVKAMVLVDMIGDKKLNILRDPDSTPWMTDLIWGTAKRLGYGTYFLGNELPMEDDHIPWVQAGIPSVDIIDFDFGPQNAYWHTPSDTLDKISGESIKIVSDVVIESLPNLFSQLGHGPS